MGGSTAHESNRYMADKPLRRYIFASDFDKTLTFNDSGYVLAELVGIPTEDFERKAQGNGQNQSGAARRGTGVPAAA